MTTLAEILVNSKQKFFKNVIKQELDHFPISPKLIQEIDDVVIMQNDSYSPFKSSSDTSVQPYLVKGSTYRNKTQYLRKVWQDLLSRLLKK